MSALKQTYLGIILQQFRNTKVELEKEKADSITLVSGNFMQALNRYYSLSMMAQKAIKKIQENSQATKTSQNCLIWHISITMLAHLHPLLSLWVKWVQMQMIQKSFAIL